MVKWFFEQYNAEHNDRVFDIDEQDKTITMNITEPPHLFYYSTGSRNKPYKSLKSYGMSKDFKPHHSKITLSSFIGRGGRGIIHEVECADNGTLTVNADARLVR